MDWQAAVALIHLHHYHHHQRPARLPGSAAHFPIIPCASSREAENKMAMARQSGSRRGSKNENDKEEEETENNGYIQVFVKPLEQGNCNLFFSWLGLSNVNLTAHQLVVVYGSAAVVCTLVLYQLLRCDVGFLFGRLCALLVPMFSILCAFYWLALYFRRTWSNTSVYLLFSSCFVGEIFAQVFFRDWGAMGGGGGGSASGSSSSSSVVDDVAAVSHATQPLVIVCVLISISLASVFSSLDTTHSATVILLVSFTRFLACSMLTDLPISLRTHLGYACGFAGILVARYMETVLKPPIQHFVTHDGKIPVIKRRRSSSSSTHAFSAHRSTRRTSLPALIQKSQTSSSGYESAIIGEAHGLITDMLADSNLPPHIVSGLRAVSNLLKPPETHGSFHKPRVSPLVSLTEASGHGSDNEESPYTGERPSSLPKRLRRSLPPSLIRRMSTSTWTTTTTATGMPTLELEPCRMRSASFRHSREGTPGSSPSGSRSNSPSPSTNNTVVLTIPKSRSFSLASATTTHPSYSRRYSRKSVANDGSLVAGSGSGSSAAFGGNVVAAATTSTTATTSAVPGAAVAATSPTRLEARVDGKVLSPLVKGELQAEEQDGTEGAFGGGGGRAGSTNLAGAGLLRQRLITSDYESSDSPNSSDLSDNVGVAEDGSSSLRRKEGLRHHAGRLKVTCDSKRRPRSTEPDDLENDEIEEEEEEHQEAIAEEREQVEADDTLEEQLTVGERRALFTLEDVENVALLQNNRLNEWDYPIFELAQQEQTLILSKVAYKLFTEVGLMETFRIPVVEFLNYFHGLELGYRDKPYHNRVHATDVLHGVYYLTTRPIPGFTQINMVEVLSRHGSSSESECEGGERSSFTHRTSFLAEDTYGIMGGNIPALELMALYTAAAMHDYDHPGRTNAFLVATHAPQAVLYNDRSVLENHHAAAAWSLLLHHPENYFLTGLESAEFKRFRFLVIEAILATDLKRHFEILAEFNAKVNDEDAQGVDWTVETDRLLVMQMVIKLADINGPAKTHPLHLQWTMRIAEEFYEQGDEEARLGMPISPYMDRRNPQLAKLQETFINHLVAPLCNAMVMGGLVPGTWVEETSDSECASDTEKGDSTCKDTEDEAETDGESGPVVPKKRKKPRKVNCLLTKNLKENYEHWVARMTEEAAQKEALETVVEANVQEILAVSEKTEMEPIKEESESLPQSNASSADSETRCNIDSSISLAATMLAASSSSSSSSSTVPSPQPLMSKAADDAENT